MGVLNLVALAAGIALIAIGYSRARGPWARYQALQAQDLRGAEALFSQIITLAPDFAEGWNKRATVRFLLHEFEGAIEDCRETLARNPNHFGALSGQGLCHFALGQHREAATLFRRALDVYPHLVDARRSLSTALNESVKANGHMHP